MGPYSRRRSTIYHGIKDDMQGYRSRASIDVQQWINWRAMFRKSGNVSSFDIFELKGKTVCGFNLLRLAIVAQMRHICIPSVAPPLSLCRARSSRCPQVLARQWQPSARICDMGMCVSGRKVGVDNNLRERGRCDDGVSQDLVSL
jgi:hypothetical protein